MPTSVPPTTIPFAAEGTIRCGRMFKRRLREVLVRAWVSDTDTEQFLDVEIETAQCVAAIYSEKAKLREVNGEADPAGTGFVMFRLPNLDPMPGEAYFIRVTIVLSDETEIGTRDFFFGTT